MVSQQKINMNFGDFADALQEVGEPVVAGNKDKLPEVVLWLKKMDSSVHSTNALPLSYEELRIYGLILNHVNMYLLLLLVEEGSERRGRLQMELQSELRRSKRMHVSGDGEDANAIMHLGSLVSFKCIDVQSAVTSFIKLLKECRSRSMKMHASQMANITKSIMVVPELIGNPKTASEKERGSQGAYLMQYMDKGKILMDQLGDDIVVFSAETDDSCEVLSRDEKVKMRMKKKLRKEILIDCLRDLEEIGRLRSYAPPKDGEIWCYREIRRLVISSLEYVKAKVVLQVCQQEPEHHGGVKWIPISFFSYYTNHGFPQGLMFAASWNGFPEFQSLIKECSHCFSDICSSFYEDGMVISGMDNVDKERDGGKQAQGSHWLEEKENKSGGYVMGIARTSADKNKMVVEEDKGRKKTRVQYLEDILRIFVKINLKTELTIAEVRLSSQIYEHVDSSIWMFGTERRKPQELLQQERSVNSKVKSYLIDGNSNDYKACDIPGFICDNEIKAVDDNAGNAVRKSREHYLQEIVSLVEEIKCLYFDTPPTWQELGYYHKIGRHIDANFMEIKIHGQETPAFSPDVVMPWRYLNYVHETQLEMLESLEKEFGELSKKIIPGIRELEAAAALKWVEDTQRNGSVTREIRELQELCQSPRGLEILDRSILILTKMYWLLSDFYSKIDDANTVMDGLFRSKEYEVLIKATSGAIDVLNQVFPSSGKTIKEGTFFQRKIYHEALSKVSMCRDHLWNHHEASMSI